MNIHVSGGPPKHLRITQQMIADLVWDPVMAAKVLMGFELDVFQKARLRMYWHCPFLMDSSGFSTGKTITDFAYIALRCLLMESHRAGVYYPVFEQGKSTFWTYFKEVKHPIFQAHMGRMDEKGEEDGKSKSQGAACFKAFYKNGSETWMPAPSFTKDAMTQASFRFNTLLVEEWTHVDSSSDGINKQLIGRTTKPGAYNEEHPVWMNHIHFTAPAQTRVHPGFARYKEHADAVKKADPCTATLSFCYKDHSHLTCRTGKTFSREYRNQPVISKLKASLPASQFIAEGLGIWWLNCKGWFSEEMIQTCIQVGEARGIEPLLGAMQDVRALITSSDFASVTLDPVIPE